MAARMVRKDVLSALVQRMKLKKLVDVLPINA
jgi:hypothetical protein